MGNKSSSVVCRLAIDDGNCCPARECQSRRRWPRQPSIFRAIDANDCHRLRQLIKCGHNINKRDANGLTPLHLAAINANEDCLRILIESGALLRMCPLRQTTLHFAAQNGTEGMVDILVNYGSFIDAKDLMGSTPLAAAVEVNRADTAVALLRRGALLQPSVCVSALQHGFTQLFRDLLNFRPCIVGLIELKDFRFTRVTVAGLKILFFAGFPIDDTVVSHIKPLEWSDFCLTGRITLPPHQYNRDKDFEAFESFANWLDTREDVLSLKCLCRLAFRKACNENSMDAVFSELPTLPNVLKQYLLLKDVNE